MEIDDKKLVALLFARDPQAIELMADQYGAYCLTVAQNVIGDPQDAEECVSDAYLAVWDAVPPAEPTQLLAYLAKTTRNLALDRLAHRQAQKRDDRVAVLLSELEEVLPGGVDPEDTVAERELISLIDRFLREKARRQERLLFARRYFWGDSIAELQARFGGSESKLKSQLHRTRTRLRRYLEEGGVLP